MTHPWPLFDLRVLTAQLELRPPSDEDLLALLDVARAGIHDPKTMPFDAAWTDAEGPAFEHAFLKFFWGTRASWTPEAWKLPLAVVVGGHPVGVQELRATDFAHLRTVETGSWLGMTRQGAGLGTEMRAAALHLAFEGLGATTAVSAALAGNEASRRVSEKLGYRPHGYGFVAPRGTPVRQDRFLLLREDFPADRWPARIEGLEGCRAMFGQSSSTTAGG